MSKSALIRSILLLMGVGLAALLASAGGAVWLVAQTRSNAEVIDVARGIRLALVQLRTLAQDVETGQRGYLLTGELPYLEPYHRAAEELPRTMATLEERVAHEPLLRPAQARLAQIVGELLAEAQRLIELEQQGRRAEALQIVRADRGKQLMDEARELISESLDLVDRRLVTSNATLAANSRTLLLVTSASLVLVLVVAVAAVWAVVRYLRDREAAGRAVEEANASLEERVAERTAELAAANDEIQRFAYIVSHDLRAPLVNVMGFTAELEVALGALRGLVDSVEERGPELLTDEARLAAREDLPEAIGFIRSSTERMDRLINAILRLSREGRRALKPEVVDMTALLTGLSATVQHQLAEASGEVRIEQPLPSLISDRLALEQVFGNLLDNAVKYLDPDRPGRIVVRGRSEGARAVYEVEDNGRGIAARDHERIFELFRRSGAQDRPGEGIGLAHVRALVRRLGGSITLSSEPGRGSVFRINLPKRVSALQGESITA
jgi:signal transduction histidine kinase